MRDVESDHLLLKMRTLFNQSRWAELERHRLWMSDWLEDRGRLEEAEFLRSSRWILLVHEGQGWPTPCVIVGQYVTGTSRHIYLDSDWIELEQLEHQQRLLRYEAELVAASSSSASSSSASSSSASSSSASSSSASS